MFGSNILEVAIGLVFIYCLYSLLATTIQELIASVLGLRARKLEVAIWRMLADNKPRSTERSLLLTEFYDHPLIKFMNEGGHFHRKPSYISAKDFARVLIDVLADYHKHSGPWTSVSISNGLQTVASEDPPKLRAQDNTPPQSEHAAATDDKHGAGNNPAPQSETVLLLQSLYNEANNDIMKFRALLEQWFDDMMNRTTGWYKRQAQWILLVIGFVLAVSFNANTFEIAKRLSTDTTTLGQVVQLATNFSKTHPAAPGMSSTVEFTDSVTIGRIDSLALFADSLSRAEIRQANEILGLGWTSGTGYSGWGILVAFAGWIVTALAISLGAPFWFDLLSKLVQLRGSGPKPGDSSTSPASNEVPLTQRKG